MIRFLPYWAIRLMEVASHWLTFVSNHGDHPGHGLF